MRGQEANPLHALDVVQAAQKLRQFGIDRLIQSVTIDDLTKQRNFFDALGCQGTCMGQDLFRITAAFGSAFVGNDAVGTGMGTAVNHRHISGNRVPLIPFRQDDFPPVPFKISLSRSTGFLGNMAADDIIHDRFRVGRRCEYVHPGQLFPQGFRVFIADHAAHQPNDHVRILFLSRFEGTEPTQCPVFRTLADHAGVQDNDVRVFRFFDSFISQ